MNTGTGMGLIRSAVPVLSVTVTVIPRIATLRGGVT